MYIVLTIDAYTLPVTDEGSHQIKICINDEENDNNAELFIQEDGGKEIYKTYIGKDDLIKMANAILCSLNKK